MVRPKLQFLLFTHTKTQASVFKAKCLIPLDDVAEHRSSIVITKRGRPVARLVPIDDDEGSTMGTVTLIANDDEDYLTTGKAWDAEG